MADLEDLYRRHLGAAMKAAWLVNDDHDGAAELVQEAFVRCAGRIGGIRDVTGFGRYWQQAVIRLAANRSRDAGYQNRLVRRLATTRHADDRIEDAVLDRLNLTDALRSLPARQRAVLVARYYLDLSEADTADALGMRLGTVKSTTARALDALRGVMAKEAGR